VGLVGLALAGARSLEQREAERRAETARQVDAVNAALDKAAALEKEDRWPEARAVLDGAQRLLADSGPIALVERVNRARADADMVAELEEIRLRLSDATPLSPEKLYANAFRNYGIPLVTLTSAAPPAREAVPPAGEFAARGGEFRYGLLYQNDRNYASGTPLVWFCALWLVLCRARHQASQKRLDCVPHSRPGLRFIRWMA
jgi:hypothetical protein